MFFIEQIKNINPAKRYNMLSIRLRYMLPSTLILLSMVVYTYHQAWSQ